MFLTFIGAQSEIATLHERLKTLTDGLTSTSSENSDLHRRIEQLTINAEKDKQAFQAIIDGMKGAEEQARAAQQLAQADVARQAHIARQAHDQYQAELLAHAEDVKSLSDIKQKLQDAQQTANEARADAATARQNLQASIASWESQREALAKELEEVTKRYGFSLESRRLSDPNITPTVFSSDVKT